MCLKIFTYFYGRCKFLPPVGTQVFIYNCYEYSYFRILVLEMHFEYRHEDGTPLEVAIHMITNQPKTSTKCPSRTNCECKQ